MSDSDGSVALAALEAAEGQGLPARRDLARRVRAASAELAAEAEKRGGARARLALWAKLFRLGVFDEPPLSGAAYDAWRELDADYRARMENKAETPCRTERGIFSDALAEALPSAKVEADASARPSVTEHENAHIKPLFSVLMPVYNPQPEHLAAAVESVFRQSCPRWELCIADDCSTDPEIAVMLRQFAARDLRVKVTFRTANGHISEATNSALAMAEGEWCALLDHDDRLAANALATAAEGARLHPDAAVLFSDEDQFSAEQNAGANEHVGREQRANPMFKPGLDPDLLLACNCVSHFGVYRSTLLRKIGGFRKGFEGAQDYDLVLRCLAEAGPRALVHMPGVLYHWRRHEGSTSVDWQTKPYVRASIQAARRNFAAATGLAAEFVFRPASLYANVSFLPPHPAPLLSLCVLADSGLAGNAARLLAERTAWAKKEIILVAREGEVSAHEMERALSELHGRAVVVSEAGDVWDLAEAGAKAARGRVLAFIHLGDVPVSPDWAGQAMGALCRPDVAVAGCRSLNRESFLVQAGYAVGHGEALLLCPAYAGLHPMSGGYFSWAHLLHSAAAAQLSGFFCERALYERMGGFAGSCRNKDNELADADFCLRAWGQEQKRTVIVPGADLLSDRIASCHAADGAFAARWGELLEHAPPWQSPLLTWTPGGWKFRTDIFS